MLPLNNKKRRQALRSVRQKDTYIAAPVSVEAPVVKEKKVVNIQPKPPVRKQKTPLRVHPTLINSVKKGNSPIRAVTGSEPIPEDKYLYKVITNNAWKGKPCFLVGGGPSLRGFNFHKLDGHRTIGVNKSFIYFDPTINISMDSRLYNWIVGGTLGKENKVDVRKRFYDTTAIRVWVRTHGYKFGSEVYILKASSLSFGYPSKMELGIHTGGNSGFCALQLAILLGANPIYLLGYDMKGENEKQAWWHNGYPQMQPVGVYKQFKAVFERFSAFVAERGIQVVNLNPDSELRCFDFDTFDNVTTTKPIPIYRDKAWKHDEPQQFSVA